MAQYPFLNQKPTHIQWIRSSLKGTSSKVISVFCILRAVIKRHGAQHDGLRISELLPTRRWPRRPFPLPILSPAAASRQLHRYGHRVGPGPAALGAQPRSGATEHQARIPREDKRSAGRWRECPFWRRNLLRVHSNFGCIFLIKRNCNWNKKRGTTRGPSVLSLREGSLVTSEVGCTQSWFYGFSKTAPNKTKQKPRRK